MQKGSTATCNPVRQQTDKNTLSPQAPARMLTATILSISLLTVMAGAAMAPALGVIRAHFTDQSALVVQLIVSLPALFIIVTNLLFPILCRWMKTRTLATVGLLLYVAAGAGAFFVDNIGLLLFFRALLGVSVGMIMPLSTGLLSYYYPPEDQARLMGLAAAMNQMGGVVATFLAGFLAGISWNCAFLVYLLGLLALVLVLLFLPNERLATGRETMAHAPDYYESEVGVTRARKNPDNVLRSLARFAPSVVGMFLTMCLFFIFPTNFAITAAHNPTLSVGTITLIMVGLDVVAFAIGLAFGRLMRLLPRQMKYIAPLGFLLGYACFAAGTSLPLLLVGCLFVGVANGVGVPYLNTIASIKGGQDAATTVMPLISAALYLGQFLSPLVVSPVAGLIGGATAPYLVGVAIALLFLLQAFLTRRYQALSPIREMKN